MAAAAPRSLFDLFADIPDTRHKQGRRHPLQAVLAMSVAAMLSGCKTQTAIVDWGRQMYARHREWMWKLGFRSFTTPAISTLHEVYKAIDIDEVEVRIAAWIDGLVGHSGWHAVSLDGKTLCGSARQAGDAPGVHLVSAYLHDPGGVLAQLRVDAKTNEHKAALDLLDRLLFENTVVLGDAMFCQRDLSQAILDRGGDYFFAVKDNQPALKEHIAAAFAPPASPLGSSRVAS